MAPRLLIESSTTTALSGTAAASSNIMRAGDMGLWSHRSAAALSKFSRLFRFSLATACLRSSISERSPGDHRSIRTAVRSASARAQWPTMPTSVGSERPMRLGWDRCEPAWHPGEELRRPSRRALQTGPFPPPAPDQHVAGWRVVAHAQREIAEELSVGGWEGNLRAPRRYTGNPISSASFTA